MNKVTSLRKQRGVALIFVILIVAMVSIIATNISSRNQLSMQRTLNLAQFDQAYWYAISAEELAMKVLKQDMKDADGTVNLQQYWAVANVVFPAEYGEIAGEITDMRSCFNLNAVSQPRVKDSSGQMGLSVAAKQYKALLVALGVDDFAAERLTQTLKDYLDADSENEPYGAEDAEYESRPVPYRAANTLMQHRSELRAVLGYTQDIYLALQPYVCAIPGDRRQLLNVNTLKVEQAALMVGMLDNKVSLSDAKSIINQRPASGYEAIDDFWANSALSNVQSSDADLKSSFVVDSNYFNLTAGAKVDTAIFKMDSVLKRNGEKFEVITRQYGGQQ
ncbi:type II secretion system minor pseudopilin GspK [Shewanella intestini]|uniref:Type II secretion system protein K n=1 Tax=Shewanella intestini TaxID=2017544 RepID=A0ABS5I5Q0_9GAMM|nr:MULTISPECIES: type II secretion system minor pseudopilin GspK [Shewanella]MBR9729352.1 type II secretion system minor pseudopilin GspK [Shewanella intestini]MRG37431.1 general secretion pathway protein GspK [Shewanella sp. XMDDZSB0408]